ncbi:uncharacterized protein LOC111121643 isoform X1 [Crassostrea virginica]
MAVYLGPDQACPGDLESWNEASSAAPCTPPSVYHCLRTSEGSFIETCLNKTWIQPNMCPEFNTRLRMVDVDVCKGDNSECPGITYWSNAVFIYPPCLRATKDNSYNTVTETQTNNTRTGTTPTPGDPSTDIQALLPYIVGGAVLVALLFVVLFVCVLRCRKRDRHRGHRHEIKIEFRKKQDINIQDDIISDRINGGSSPIRESIDAEKRPFLDPPSPVLSPASNITVYVGDDKDQLAQAYEPLVYENRYDKCQFVKNLSEFKVDRWTKVYFMQDVFSHVIDRSDIDKMRVAFDEVYLAATQQPTSAFVLEMPMMVWKNHKQYLQEMPLFQDQYISLI